MSKTSHFRPALVHALILAAPAAVAQQAAPHGERNLLFLQGEQMEYRATGQDQGRLSWDIRGWLGGDYDRLWFKTQGDAPVHDAVARSEMQARYSHMISPYWDAMLGVRYDIRPEPSRAYAVAAFHGLSPYLYEVDADVFVSEQGDVSARLEVEYSLLLTQRLILVPSFELNFAVQQVAELGVGSGLSDVELGLRLRYEIERELAPYIGFVWERQVGTSAALAREAGHAFDIPSFVAGVRFWY